METSFVTAGLPRAGALVIFAGEGGKLGALASQADSKTGGHVKRAIKASSFTGKKDQVLDIVSPSGPFSRLFVFGTGRDGGLQPLDFQMLGGAIAGTLQAAKVVDAHVLVEWTETAALLAAGARLRVYAFNRYKSKPSESAVLKSLAFHCPDHGAAKKAFARQAAVVEGVHLARNLVNEPPNRLFPAEFANRARELARHGVKVEILTPGQMRKLGMGALLGVAQGSAHEARLAVMRWDGGRKGEKPVAFIGKGVTFDTGGISIKPAAGMEDMKGDMAGAACVTGLMLALARRKAKVNAVGAIGLVENMPDGNAQRPGDIVTSMSGQTIAVLNTDAEGRLVLADVLWYVQNRFKPQFMVNLATLTGAIMVSLGKEHAGLFSNNDELSKRLSEAGIATGEKVWRMPLAPEYDKLIDSDVADMKNIGGRYGGAITAAQFLQRFVNGVPWAHLDIAGTAIDSARTSINQSWGSGWGVRLLDRLVTDHYEG